MHMRTSAGHGVLLPFDILRRPEWIPDTEPDPEPQPQPQPECAPDHLLHALARVLGGMLFGQGSTVNTKHLVGCCPPSLHGRWGGGLVY